MKNLNRRDNNVLKAIQGSEPNACAEMLITLVKQGYIKFNFLSREDGGMTYLDLGIETIEQGWQCPLCKRIYASSTPICPYCGDNLKGEFPTDSNPEPKDLELEKNSSEEESCA